MDESETTTAAAAGMMGASAEPMARFESSRLIACSPADVFALVADGVRLHRLAGEPETAAMRREVSAEHAGGPEMGRGAAFTVRERIRGRDMGTTRYETTDYEPDRLVVHRTDDGGFDLVFELEERDGVTLLTAAREYHEEGGVRGRLARGSLTEETVRPLLDQELVRIDRALGADGADDARGCRASTTVNRPPSAAFAFLADGHSLGEWMTEPSGEGTRAHVEHLDGPRVGVGAHYSLTQRAGKDAPTESEFTTVEYEPDRRVAFRFENFFDMVFTVEAGSSGGALVTLARRPVPRPRGLRGRIYARSAFTAERMLPEIERELAAVERAIGG